ncbi:uncharacterized protein LOC112560246 [Pomacea canaliculata]|uniref:uncharacterized protein LOC112560246 n=1 Tax=Pomacea canaliculata TaxID=400727 RepID=UPI000D72E9C3|nr:uncharacterized protein LOC112560246 [Pomacea canaliculata]
MSYQLYELTALNELPDTLNIRIYTTSNTDPTPDINAVCSLNASEETPTYLFEVSSAQDKDINITSLSSLAQPCPPEVQATYSYVVDGTGCNGSDSDLNFCVDRRTARTDYGLCSSRILFSAGGNLTCIAAFRVSGALVVMLLNQDVSLVTSTSRFACMVNNFVVFSPQSLSKVYLFTSIFCLHPTGK